MRDIPELVCFRFFPFVLEEFLTFMHIETDRNDLLRDGAQRRFDWNEFLSSDEIQWEERRREKEIGTANQFHAHKTRLLDLSFEIYNLTCIVPAIF